MSTPSIPAAQRELEGPGEAGAQPPSRPVPVSREDNFFLMGGHSLSGMQMVSRIRRRFGVRLSLRDLFAHPVLADLARLVERLGTEIGEDRIPVVDRSVPLLPSFAQERLWIVDQLERAYHDPCPVTYLVPFHYELTGPLDSAIFRAAFQDLVARQEALRTCFRSVSGRPMQVIAPQLAFELPLLDWTALSASERDARLRAEAAIGFELDQAPLFRAALIRVGDQRHIFLIVLHHIISDGWSLNVLANDLTALYAARSEPGAVMPPAPPIQYADFVAWQRGDARRSVHAEQLEYWQRQLAGMPDLLDLPLDHPRPDLPSPVGRARPLAFSRALTEGLKRVGARHEATLFMTLAAAYAVLLWRHGAQEDFGFGSPAANRTREETESLIGFFVNVLVLRARLHGNPTFEDFLKQMRRTCLDAYANQELPFEQLVGALNPERSMAYSPLVQAVFVLQNNERGELSLPGVESVRGEIPTNSAKYDLALILEERHGALEGRFEYGAHLFESATVDRMAERLGLLLGWISDDPGRPLSDLPSWAA